MKKVLKIGVHVGVWLLYLLVTIVWLYSGMDFGWNGFYRALLMVMFQIVIFYANTYFFMPRILEKNKVILYIATILMTISALTFLNYSVQRKVFKRSDRFMRKRIERIERLEESNISSRKLLKKPKRIVKLEFVGFFLISAFPLIFMLFISSLYRNIMQTRNREKAEMAMIEAESKFLKSQINPHFLFNAMNNIYTLSTMKSDEAPKAIHLLSDMLRYVIYESGAGFVTLGRESQYIQNYISLMEFRDDAIAKNVSFLSTANTHLKIAPMILMPFVENAFKHSKIEDEENGWINISMTSMGNRLEFLISNSMPSAHYSKDKVGGVGLSNVKRRLSLQYKNMHELVIDNTEHEFKVNLKIELT